MNSHIYTNIQNQSNFLGWHIKMCPEVYISKNNICSWVWRLLQYPKFALIEAILDDDVFMAASVVIFSQLSRWKRLESGIVELKKTERALRSRFAVCLVTKPGVHDAIVNTAPQSFPGCGPHASLHYGVALGCWTGPHTYRTQQSYSRNLY